MHSSRKEAKPKYLALHAVRKMLKNISQKYIEAEMELNTTCFALLEPFVETGLSEIIED